MSSSLGQLLKGSRGHFVLESGYHAEWWFQLESLFDRPDRLAPFVDRLARQLAAHEVETVCGPMTGGAELARLVASELNVPACFTVRREEAGATGLFPIRYEIPPEQRGSLRKKRVAIVDDAVSAGSAARGTYQDLVACSAQPVVLGALVVFGDHAKQFAKEKGMALESVETWPLGVWAPPECPLCRAGRRVEPLPTMPLRPG